MLKLKSKKRQPGERGRQRALPLPNALAWTIADFQRMGGPGKTSIYALAKADPPKLKLFKDGAGRTMVDGDSGRALLSIKSSEQAA